MGSRLWAVRVRKARQEDVGTVAALLYESSPKIYDRFAGNRERAVAILERAFSEPGSVASSEVVWIVEVEGRPVAAMAAFPISEGPDRARSFVRLALRRVPFWLWGRTLRLYSAGTRVARGDSLYIDALATDPAFRRRGAARELLDQADREARAHGLGAVTLDTTIDNEGARALYADAGFDEVAYRAASRALPGFVALVRPVDR
jgi:ribosomal protein S18 acetylase RimI-like enzyme